MTYGRPNWFDRVKEEHLACREKVALFDMSAFAKLEIEVTHGHRTMIIYSIPLSTSLSPSLIDCRGQRQSH